MICILILLISHCAAVNIDFLKIVLSGNLKEIYNLSNPRKAITDSVSILKKIDLSNADKKIIWEAIKGPSGPQNLTANDLTNITDLMNIIPEDDLCHLNLTDWDIIETLGKVNTFSRSQVSVLADSLKITHSLKILTRSDSLNKLSSLICGFSEEDLAKIPKHDFKKIKSRVFSNLNACSHSQLRVLYNKIVHIYGAPQTWLPNLVKHIGMVILSLNRKEIRSLRAASLQNLDTDMIKKYKPELFKDFTVAQLEDLTVHTQTNHTFKSSSQCTKTTKLCVLMGLLYLLPKF